MTETEGIIKCLTVAGLLPSQVSLCYTGNLPIRKIIGAVSYCLIRHNFWQFAILWSIYLVVKLGDFVLSLLSEGRRST